MVLGFNLRDTLRNKRNINTVIERNDRLEEIIDLINEKYVDTVNSNHLYEDAVSGILKSLDPHTVYIPAEDLQGVNDDLDGGFSGIGVEFAIIRDTVQFTSIVDNGPAAKAGLEPGDRLVRVGDSLVAGKSITSERIMRLLKGKQKSKVSVVVKRAITDSILQFRLNRDIIPTYSIDAGIMLDAVTGFIKINRFSATTYKEFNSALTQLKDKGAKQIILDLRGNPGGYLDAASKIADDFLDDNKLIVYTQGTHNTRTEYKAQEDGLFEQGKLIVLVDEGSASASEILAGAIQDWDRGVVVGRRSYGKGLVQEQYEMPDGAGLRLTIAKYYTPSGRCIQRSFAKGKDAYREEYVKRFEAEEITGQDTAAIADTTCYYTANKRVVYGGGGIKPDVYVPIDTARITAAMAGLLYSEELRNAIWDYYIQNRKALKYKDVADFSASFAATEQVTTRLLASLKPDERKIAVKELAKPSNKYLHQMHIKAQIARYLYRDNGYYAITIKEDQVVKKALQVLSSPVYSKIVSGK
jgi:carboxyl-terminal processing protease